MTARIPAISKRYTYDPVTGTLANRKTGKPYTTANSAQKYVLVYMAECGRGVIRGHHLARALHHGKWPDLSKPMYHRDRDTTNNAIDNLEVAHA